MAVAVKRLDVNVGDLVEIDGRTYDVVSDKSGGVALEPAITVFSADLHRRHATRPVSHADADPTVDELMVNGPGQGHPWDAPATA